MAVAHVLDVGVLGPVELVGGDANPLLDEYPLRDTGGIGVAEEFANLLLDRLNFVFARALAPGHPILAVLIEDIQGHGSETACWIEGGVADVSRRYTQDGESYRCGYLLFQRAVIGVHATTFP